MVGLFPTAEVVEGWWVLMGGVVLGIGVEPLEEVCVEFVVEVILVLVGLGFGVIWGGGLNVYFFEFREIEFFLVGVRG